MRCVSMARRRRTGLRENRILVAISILGLDENGYRRTQNEVCAVLKMAKSMVSECIRYQKTMTMTRLYVKPDFEVIVNNGTSRLEDGLYPTLIIAFTYLGAYISNRGHDSSDTS